MILSLPMHAYVRTYMHCACVGMYAYMCMWMFAYMTLCMCMHACYSHVHDCACPIIILFSLCHVHRMLGPSQALLDKCKDDIQQLKVCKNYGVC